MQEDCLGRFLVKEATDMEVFPPSLWPLPQPHLPHAGLPGCAVVGTKMWTGPTAVLCIGCGCGVAMVIHITGQGGGALTPLPPLPSPRTGVLFLPSGTPYPKQRILRIPILLETQGQARMLMTHRWANLSIFPLFRVSGGTQAQTHPASSAPDRRFGLGMQAAVPTMVASCAVRNTNDRRRWVPSSSTSSPSQSGQ